MNQFEFPQNNTNPRSRNGEPIVRTLSGVDLRTIDGGRLISPSRADGPNVHLLEIVGVDIPVSFTILNTGHFRLNGLQKESDKGLVVSGFKFGETAKINHIEINNELKQYAREHGNIRIGEALLLDLERQLKNEGVKNVVVVFYKLETISFFIRNDYSIASIDSLSNDQKVNLNIDGDGFDKRIVSSKAFNQLVTNKDSARGHILLTKNLG